MVHFELGRSHPTPTAELSSNITTPVHKKRHIAQTSARVGAGTFFAAASVWFLAMTPVTALEGDGEGAIGCAVDTPIAALMSTYFFKNRLRRTVNTTVSTFGHEIVEGIRETRQDIHEWLEARKETVLEENKLETIPNSGQLVEQPIEPQASETFLPQESL